LSHTTRGGGIDECIFPNFFRSFAADLLAHIAIVMITETLLSTAPAPVPLTAGGHTFRMAPVRGGEFDMGDEHGDLWDACRPVHRVRLDDFWIGQFPVTQALWRAVSLTPGPSPEERGEGLRRPAFDPDSSFFKGDRRPVECVSWDGTTRGFF